MFRFKEYLEEAANTDAADINEILFGYYLAGENWKKFEGAKDAQTQIEKKRQKVGDDVYNDQDGKAKTMANVLIQWARTNGYDGKVVKVWWTARPGVLSKAVGVAVDSRKNPTDILVQFSSGEFLGLSAKSTKSQGDIGFKNPGVGTVEKNLRIKLNDVATRAVEALMKKYPDLSASSKKRKTEIRASEEMKAEANMMGSQVLKGIRDRLLKKVSGISQAGIKKYLLTDWMDATESYPRYVKVTGMKTGASVEDPLANSKIAALSAHDVTFTEVGNDSIGVLAGGKRIMKMRAKYESQKLASAVKFSGDPWK
jgi:hypothetical protein